MLTRVKDRLFIYQIPCDCRKAYIGQTIQKLETRLKEHKVAHRKANTKTSTVAEHS